MTTTIILYDLATIGFPILAFCAIEQIVIHSEKPLPQSAARMAVT
jgi:hypothetical protein